MRNVEKLNKNDIKTFENLKVGDYFLYQFKNSLDDETLFIGKVLKKINTTLLVKDEMKLYGIMNEDENYELNLCDPNITFITYIDEDFNKEKFNKEKFINEYPEYFV